MKQYCRYCAYMISGDFNYCEVKKKCFSENTIKSVNHCKDFMFNPIDALFENKNEYKPKKTVEKTKGEQLSIFLKS